jgi:hypothetical protein
MIAMSPERHDLAQRELVVRREQSQISISNTKKTYSIRRA